MTGETGFKKNSRFEEDQKDCSAVPASVENHGLPGGELIPFTWLRACGFLKMISANNFLSSIPRGVYRSAPNRPVRSLRISTERLINREASGSAR